MYFTHMYFTHIQTELMFQFPAAATIVFFYGGSSSRTAPPEELWINEREANICVTEGFS